MLKRALAYTKAGADGILVHSKRSDHTEIEAFMKVHNTTHEDGVATLRHSSCTLLCRHGRKKDILAQL